MHYQDVFTTTYDNQEDEEEDHEVEEYEPTEDFHEQNYVECDEDEAEMENEYEIVGGGKILDEEELNLYDVEEEEEEEDNRCESLANSYHDSAYCNLSWISLIYIIMQFNSALNFQFPT